MLGSYDGLLKSIEEVREKYVSHMAHGSVKNFEEYKFLLGKIWGLKEAVDAIRDHVKKNSD